MFTYLIYSGKRLHACIVTTIPRTHAELLNSVEARGPLKIKQIW